MINITHLRTKNNKVLFTVNNPFLRIKNAAVGFGKRPRPLHKRYTLQLNGHFTLFPLGNGPLHATIIIF